MSEKCLLLVNEKTGVLYLFLLKTYRSIFHYLSITIGGFKCDKLTLYLLSVIKNNACVDVSQQNRRPYLFIFMYKVINEQNISFIL